MALKRLFIAFWIFSGIATSSSIIFNFKHELYLVIVLTLFFLFSLWIQYVLRLNLLDENVILRLENKSLFKQLKRDLFYSFLVGFLQTLILFLIGYKILSPSIDYERFQLYIFTIGLLQPFLLNFIHWFFYFIQNDMFLNKEIERYQKLSKITQKKTLQDLVSPHFLFNSLNTVASITSENPDSAVEFVNKLSDLYEFILKNNENQLIELKEELEIVEKYGFLIQTRFGDFFYISINIPEKFLKTLIPPLTLQNLVENAVKHNSVTRKKPLILTIKVFGDYLVIQNNMNPKKIFKNESTKLGLQYIKNQFQQFSIKTIRVTHNKDFFRVEIPLIYKSKI